MQYIAVQYGKVHYSAIQYITVHTMIECHEDGEPQGGEWTDLSARQCGTSSLGSTHIKKDCLSLPSVN